MVGEACSWDLIRAGLTRVRRNAFGANEMSAFSRAQSFTIPGRSDSR